MSYQYNDGGRASAGYKGEAGDCGVRAVAIATGKPYQQAFDELKELSHTNPRNGLFVRVMHLYMERLGWKWVPTMTFGSGCKVHLRADELPKGNLIARVSKHYVAMIDGIVNDTHDCTRDGKRCVYGYWVRP